MGIKNINKKGMLARDWFVMLIIFGVITGLGYLVVADFASESSGYAVENMTDDDFQDNYDTLTDSVKNVSEMQNKTAAKGGLDVISTFTTLFTATINIITIVLGSFSMASNVMTNFAIDFGVPTVVANLIFPAILALIIGIIIFVIISSISKGKM